MSIGVRTLPKWAIGLDFHIARGSVNAEPFQYLFGTSGWSLLPAWLTRLLTQRSVMAARNPWSCATAQLVM